MTEREQETETPLKEQDKAKKTQAIYTDVQWFAMIRKMVVAQKKITEVCLILESATIVNDTNLKDLKKKQE